MTTEEFDMIQEDIRDIKELLAKILTIMQANKLIEIRPNVRTEIRPYTKAND